VKFDVDRSLADGIRRCLDYLDGRSAHYLTLISTDDSFLRRTKGIGVMTARQAEDLGVVGPTARASGLPRDIRAEAPYAAYAEFPARIVLEQAGDLSARFVVRVRELLDSSRIIRDVLDRLPDGPLAVKMPRHIKPGETISRVEAPRGELFYFIRSTGGGRPDRIKVRTPTICNMASVLTLTVGHQLADVPMILAGVDPCFSCNDRVVVLRDGAGQRRWSWQRLREHGIEVYRR
jgi:NADH-quinone oxidoreductase subunit D